MHYKNGREAKNGDKIVLGKTVLEFAGVESPLFKPVGPGIVLYGEAFMKYSLSVSREQELSADALSLRIAGKGAVVTALVQSEAYGPLWGAYLATEVIPLLEKSFLPPLLEGWRLFQTGIEKATESTPTEAKTRDAGLASDSPRDDDTHPTLEQRLAALGAERADARPGETSLDLLDDDAFEEPRPQLAWAWDDLGYTTGAVFGALNVAENRTSITIAPGSR